MNIDDTWLDGASATDLEALARALLDGRVGGQFSIGAVQHAGFGEGAARFLDAFRGTDPQHVAWMLQRLSRERTRADDRYASVASLVWSGRARGISRSGTHGWCWTASSAGPRVTCSSPRSSSTMASACSRPSPIAFASAPDIAVDLYVNLTSTSGRDEDESADAARFLESFARDHWPSDLPLPAIYYDPETRKHGVKRAALHASASSWISDGRSSPRRISPRPRRRGTSRRACYWIIPGLPGRSRGSSGRSKTRGGLKRIEPPRCGS